MDKTDLVYQIVCMGGYYFLSRPRRFGKSLLLSTMEAYFQGKKELFEGLAIGKLEKDWTEYPVLHLDLGGKTYQRNEDLDMILDLHLSRWENEIGMQTAYPEPDLRFQTIIDTAYQKTGKPVVILVDEYDKPIVDNLDKDELKEAFRSRLSGFYSVMKAQDGKIPILRRKRTRTGPNQPAFERRGIRPPEIPLRWLPFLLQQHRYL